MWASYIHNGNSYGGKTAFVYLGCLYPRPTKLEGGYTGFTLSVRPSVRPAVCL